jgi:hypothetical protein
MFQSPTEPKLSLYYSFLRPYCQTLLGPLRLLEYDIGVNRGEYRPPPESVKVRLIRRHLLRTSSRVFVETGTYLGDTAKALHSYCSRLITIELVGTIHAVASRRLHKYANVTVLLGDCEVLLPRVLSELSTDAAFWLDAHYSAGITGKGHTADPILTSLAQIGQHKINHHTIMIDDARTFDGMGERPRLDTVIATLYSINERYIVTVQNDIIVATPHCDDRRRA